MKIFDGRVAVITGGGGVLCSEMARALAEQGAKTAILDLNPEAAQKVADEICTKGGNAIGVKCNVLEKDSIESARAVVHERLGKCNILINGAGGNSPKASTTNEVYMPEDVQNDDVASFFDLTKEGFGFVFDLNIIGTVLPTQVFIKDMTDGGGDILNISSMSAACPLTKIPAYGAAKAGIENITKWLAVHFANAGIRVNAIAPGFFLTEQNKKLLTNPDGSLTPRSEKVLTHTPLKRFGQPSDLLGAVNFLLDRESSGFITGITLPIDGGFMAYSGV